MDTHTALRNRLRNVEAVMKDPATKSSEIENLRPLWLQLKARLALLEKKERA